MSENVFGLILLGVFAAALLGVYLYYRRKNEKLRASYPKTWIHRGKAPPGTDLAMQVIYEQLEVKPKRYGGYVDWVPTFPFKDADGKWYAGVVDDLEMARVRVAYREPVDATALVEEVYHVYWYQMGRGFGDGDPAFIMRVAQINAALRKRLGRL